MATNGVGNEDDPGREVQWPRRRSHVEERAAGSDLVLYDPVGGRLHVLNATAAAVWRLCDGSLQAPALADRFSAGFRVGQGQDPLSDVRELLRSFLDAGLIEDNAGDRPVTDGSIPERTQQS